jgi:hypothetical protein
VNAAIVAPPPAPVTWGFAVSELPASSPVSVTSPDGVADGTV